jgi:hypothetical protein
MEEDTNSEKRAPTGPPKDVKRKKALGIPDNTPKQNHTRGIKPEPNKRPDVPIQLAGHRDLAICTDPAFKFPRRMTVGAHQRLAELNFDPLEWSVKIARGEALTTDHPFLKVMREWHLTMLVAIEKSEPIDWQYQLEKLLVQASTSLSDSWVPLNLRSDHIKELMSYLYPKLKAVEHSGNVKTDISLKPLTKNEVEIFSQYFNDEY